MPKKKTENCLLNLENNTRIILIKSYIVIILLISHGNIILRFIL